MTPKLMLSVALVAGSLWLLRRFRHRAGNAFTVSFVELIEAACWGYALYLLVTFVFVPETLGSWSSFLDVLVFKGPIKGIQWLALAGGIAFAWVRFRERPPLETPSDPDHLRGRVLTEVEPEPQPGWLEKLRRYLDRLKRLPAHRFRFSSLFRSIASKFGRRKPSRRRPAAPKKSSAAQTLNPATSTATGTAPAPEPAAKPPGMSSPDSAGHGQPQSAHDAEKAQ